MWLEIIQSQREKHSIPYVNSLDNYIVLHSNIIVRIFRLRKRKKQVRRLAKEREREISGDGLLQRLFYYFILCVLVVCIAFLKQHSIMPIIQTTYRLCHWRYHYAGKKMDLEILGNIGNGTI